MKKGKVIIGRATLASAAIVLLLAGCGKKEDNPQVVPVKPEEIEQDQINATEEDSESQQADNISIDIEEDYFSLESEEGILLCTQDEDWAVVTIADNKEAADKINNYFLNNKEDHRNLCMEYGETAQEEYELRQGEDFYFNGCSIVTTLTKERVDDKVISFTEDLSEYTGGVHPNNSRSCMNFSTETGELLTLSDISEDVDGLTNYVNSYIEKDLAARAESIGLFDDYKNYINEIFGEGTWLLSQRGFVVICNEYIVSPHAAGTLEIDIPYSNIEEYLKKEYIPTTVSKVFNFSLNTPFYEDVDQDGTRDEIELLTEYLEDETVTAIYLSINGKQERLCDTSGYFNHACFIMKENGNCAVMFDGDMASDDYTTYVYRFDGEKAARMAVLDGAMNPNSIII